MCTLTTLAAVIFTFWNTKGTNPSILTPKRYVKIPCPML